MALALELLCKIDVGVIQRVIRTQLNYSNFLFSLQPAQIHIENRTVVKIHRKRVKDLKKQRKALRKELEKIIDNLKLNRKDFEFKGNHGFSNLLAYL